MPYDTHVAAVSATELHVNLMIVTDRLKMSAVSSAVCLSWCWMLDWHTRDVRYVLNWRRGRGFFFFSHETSNAKGNSWQTRRETVRCQCRPLSHFWSTALHRCMAESLRHLMHEQQKKSDRFIDWRDSQWSHLYFPASSSSLLAG